MAYEKTPTALARQDRTGPPSVRHECRQRLDKRAEAWLVEVSPDWLTRLTTAL